MQKTLQQVQADKDLKLANEATTAIAHKLFSVLGKSSRGSDVTLQSCNKLLTLDTDDRIHLITEAWGPQILTRAEPLLHQLKCAEDRQKALTLEINQQWPK